MKQTLNFFNTMLIAMTIIFSFTTGAFFATFATLPMMLSITSFGVLLIFVIGKLIFKEELRHTD